MAAMAPIWMTCIRTHVRTSSLDARVTTPLLKMSGMIGLIGMIAIEAGIGKEMVIKSVTVGATVPIQPVVPIRAAIKARIARAITTAIAFLRMMVAQAGLRVITRMVVTVGRTLRVAKTRSQQAESGKRSPGD